MKIKKEYIVLSVIIVSLVLYLILHNPDRTLYDLPKTPDVEKKKISKIEIKKQDVSILLNKKTDQWQIAPHGYLADTGKINNMLAVIAGFTLTFLMMPITRSIDWLMSLFGHGIRDLPWDGDPITVGILAAIMTLLIYFKDRGKQKASNNRVEGTGDPLRDSPAPHP